MAQFRFVLAQSLGVASGIVAQLAGHAALDDLPWLAVLELLTQKWIRCLLVEDDCMHWYRMLVN